MKIFTKDSLVILFFIFLVFFLRLPSFFQSELIPDESLYFFMAKNIVEGQVPYTTIWDNKPPGIYIIFSLGLILLGKSVISIRIIACLAVVISCYFLYKIGKLISQNDSKVGILAGIFYAVLTIRNGGIAANTEIFYTPFVVCGFYLLFSILDRPAQRLSSKYIQLFVIGLLLGVALQIKQVVLFDFIAILLIVILSFLRDNGRVYWTNIHLIKSNVILILGFILPLIIVVLYFAIIGHFSDYFYANFTANLARVSSNNSLFNTFLPGFLIQIKSNGILWLCLLLTPLHLLYNKQISSKEKRSIVYLLIWFSMSFLGVSSPRSFYVYYFLQLLPSLCLISSHIIIKTVWAAKEIGIVGKVIILALILVNQFVGNVYFYFKTSAENIYFRYVKGIERWGDGPAILADYLQGRVKQEDYIYIVDYTTIIYHLVPAKIPTRYIFTEFLTRPQLSKVAGIDPIQELNNIINKKPIYIIKLKENPLKDKNNSFYEQLNGYLRKYYVFEKDFTLHGDVFEDYTSNDLNEVELYRLKSKTNK